ncbi:MAG: hypothetical protein ACLPND_07535 [Candidatus Korobacteraceae bacterium]
MKKIPAGKSKAHPTVKLVPAKPNADSIFGYMVGKAKIVGDIIGPITPIEDWEILK